MAETIRGLNIKLGLDGAELNDQLKTINSNLSNMSKDLKAINQQIKFDPKNIDLWKQKQQTLNNQLANTKEKLEAQNKTLEKAKNALKLGDISEAEFNKLQRNIMYTSAEVSKLNSEIEKTCKQINSLNNAKFDNIAKIGSTLTKALTFAMGGVVSALSALTIKTTQTVDEIAKTALKLNIPIEKLQQWNYIAKSTGVSTDSLQTAFTKVNSILGNLATNKSTTATKALEKLGLTFENIKDLNTEQIFNLIQNGLKDISDETLKTGIMNDIFGNKLATELIPVLNLESNQLEELKTKANELGIVTDEQAQKSSEFAEELANTKQKAFILAVDLSSLLLPVLNDLLKIIQEKLIPMFQRLINTWNSVNDSTQKVILSIIGIVATVGPLMIIFGKVIPLINTGISLFKGLGLSGIFAGTGINFATLGIGALIAILATALLTSEDFRNILIELGKTLFEIITPLIQITQILMQALMPIFTVVINIIKSLLNIILPLVEIALIPLKIQFQFISTLLNAMLPIIQTLANLLNNILLPILEVVLSILNPILDAITKIVNAVASTGNWLLGLLGGNNYTTNDTTNNNVTNSVNINNYNSSISAQELANEIDNILGSNYNF